MIFSFAVFQFYLWHVFGKTLHFKIEDKGLMWVSAIGLFAFSYFIANEMGFIYKLFVAVLVFVLTGTYFFRNYALAKSV